MFLHFKLKREREKDNGFDCVFIINIMILFLCIEKYTNQGVILTELKM